jgi:hypothetical protein
MAFRATGPNGDYLELRVRGYQFPQIADDFYDANWLQVEADAAIGGRTWNTCDPSFCTFELSSLAEWLQSLARGDATDTFEVTEPNYRFSSLGLNSDGKWSIRVLLELEVRPAWSARDSAYHNDCWIDLALSREELLQWASDLEAQLRSFPIRGEALNPQKQWDAVPSKTNASLWQRVKSVLKR